MKDQECAGSESMKFEKEGREDLQVVIIREIPL